MRRGAPAVVALLLVALLLVACSPEASRVRNGGPGADVGNHSSLAPSPSTPPPTPGA